MHPVSLDDITIRTTLKPGDIGLIIHLHGKIYNEEYNYGIEFEHYVTKGICEFYENYDVEKDCIWICEHNEKIVGLLLLMHRPNNACQLRYFLIVPGYRQIGLGKKLMGLFIKFMHECNYSSSFLWTTDELPTAASLYKKHGFVLTEEMPSEAFGKPVIEQRYDLILN